MRQRILLLESGEVSNKVNNKDNNKMNNRIAIVEVKGIKSRV